MARKPDESMPEPGMRDREDLRDPEGMQDRGRMRDRENLRDPEGMPDRENPRDPEGMEDRDRRERRGSDAGMPGSGPRERARGDENLAADDDETWSDGYR
ncbi:hypothetical protein [Streptomyces sp. NPDC058371]|uniref:hypothetical protein n=1 Tax=Streptomyces sp. NPDC058371 TaxID=3346463 RepID=UPI0036664BF8